MSDYTWIIMPILSAPEFTRAAIADCLSQSVPTRLLLINQGVEDAFREELEGIAEEYSDRVLLWSHVPPLPSLAATWNRALQFVWECGGEEALVLNNDLKMLRGTLDGLQTVLHGVQALFVSAVGVTVEQFEAARDAEGGVQINASSRGGPDFSCFLISRECHERFQFDENFTPAFLEDLDYHRRLMLAGEGARIFSVNLPYLHYGSMTLKTIPNRAQVEAAITAGSRAYYRKKWGGDCNQETFYYPFGDLTHPVHAYAIPPCGATTPELQTWVQGQQEGTERDREEQCE